MPINRLAGKTQAEQELEAVIAARPARTEEEIAKTANVTGASRNRFGDYTEGIISSLSGRFGADVAARPSLDRIKEDLIRTDQEDLQLRKLRERRESSNQSFNFLLNRLQAAGIDRAKAEEVAIQYVQDEDRRKAVSGENEAARNVVQKKQDLLDMFANEQIKIEQRAARDREKDMIKSQLYRTFFGLAGVGVGVAIAGPVGGAAGSIVGNQLGSIVGSGSSLRERSGFVPRTA